MLAGYMGLWIGKSIEVSCHNQSYPWVISMLAMQETYVRVRVSNIVEFTKEFI